MPLVPPHGGRRLRPLLLDEPRRAEEVRRAESMPRLRVSSREKGDLVMLGIGGFTPLRGFMGRDDWRGVCDGMRTAEGLFWPIPITLSTDLQTANSIFEGDDVALADPDSDELLAVIKVEDKYRIDKRHECEAVFRTTDPAHPGVQMVMAQGEVNL